MGLFGELKTDGLEEAQDRLGGFAPLETNGYEAEIKLAYAGESTNGAMSVSIVADIDGREYRETVYVTNRQKQNFFLNKDDKTKKVPLPGFTVMDDLCLVTTDKSLAEQESEEKVVKLYDFEARQELPKSVQVLTDLLGKKVYLGIVQQLVNKNEKDGQGNYQPIAESRVENFIEKIFHHPTKLTTVEAKNGIAPENATFMDKWVTKNQGVQRDKRSIKDGAAGAPSRNAPASAPQAAGGAAPRQSLFAK